MGGGEKHGSDEGTNSNVTDDIKKVRDEECFVICAEQKPKSIFNMVLIKLNNELIYLFN